MKIDWKKTLPHIVAIAVFLGVSMAYFYPALQGNVLKTHDIKMFKGMSKEIADYRVETGEDLLWTNSMFGGMPSTHISVMYDSNLMRTVYKTMSFYLPRPINIVFLYFLGFYILLMCLKIDPYIAIVGALAFGFSSYFFVILEAGHMSKANAIAFIAPTIGGVILAYRRKLLLGAAVTALFMSLELWANHYQVTYYMVFILLFYGVSEFIRFIRQKEIGQFIKRSVVIIVAMLIAVLVNIGSIWGTAEYAKYTTRGKSDLTILAPGQTAKDSTDKTSGLDRSYITAWSYGYGETFTFLIADTKGGANIKQGKGIPIGQLHPNQGSPEAISKLIDDSRGNVAPGGKPQLISALSNGSTYWGNQGVTSGPVYVGAIVILLFLLALPFLDDKMKWFVVAVTILTIMLSWGKNYVPSISLIGVFSFFIIPFLPKKVKDIGGYLCFAFLLLLIYAGSSMGFGSLTDFFLDYVPGYNKFRSVTIILVVAELTIPLIGFLLLNYFLNNRKKVVEKINWFYIVSGGLLFLLLLFGLMPESFFNFFPAGGGGLSLAEAQQQTAPEGMGAMEYQQLLLNFYNNEYYPLLKQLRINIFTADVWRSFLLIALAGGMLFLFLKEKVSKTIVIASLGILIVFDLWNVDTRYVNNNPGDFSTYLSWMDSDEAKKPYYAFQGDFDILMSEKEGDEAFMNSVATKINQLKQDNGGSILPEEEQGVWFSELNSNSDYRVFTPNNPFNEARTSYFHKSIGGYHGAKLKRYQELIEFHIGRNNQKVLDMLNTKYFIQYAYNEQTRDINNSVMQPRPTALGNAWFVNEIKLVENADEEILALGEDKGFEPSRTAIVDKKYANLTSGDIQKDENGSIVLEKYEPNLLTYKFNASSDQIVVFSEIFYDLGWQAYIDDKPVEHFRANYILRGLKVPAGEHNVVFKYELKSYGTSSYISLISSLVVLILFGFVVYKEFTNKGDEVIVLDDELG